MLMALLLKNALLRCGARRSSFPSPCSVARLGGGVAADYSFPFSSSSSPASDNPSQEDGGGQVTATGSCGGSGAAPSPARRDRRVLSWRNPWDLVPSHLNDGLGNALMQASENLSRLLDSCSPSRLLGRLKEDDKCYKLRYEVPGLRKEDLRVTVEDGMLVITGETEDEDDEEETSTTESEGESWSYARRYGYCNATLLLPDDAKADEITAELKDGVLRIWIPRAEKKSNAREVEIK